MGHCTLSWHQLLYYASKVDGGGRGWELLLLGRDAGTNSGVTLWRVHVHTICIVYTSNLAVCLFKGSVLTFVLSTLTTPSHACPAITLLVSQQFFFEISGTTNYRRCGNFLCALCTGKFPHSESQPNSFSMKPKFLYWQ